MTSVRVKNTILTINNPSQSEFKKLWQKFQPFIIKGVADKWHACQAWSNDYLSDKCGDREIEIEYHSPKNLEGHNYVTEDYYQTRQFKFKDYLNIVKQRKKQNIQEYYLSEINFESNFPELVRDINYPNYFPRKPDVSFWFGFASKDSNSVSHLHYDLVHNIFAQIRGRKKFLFYSPTNYLSFYPPLGEKLAHINHSKVNPNEPNYHLFDKFPWQDKIEVILEPGDMLYLPPFWWHHVTALEENISLSFWYDTKPTDIFKQKRLFATYLNIAPHFINHSIQEFFWQLTSKIKTKSLISNIPN